MTSNYTNITPGRSALSQRVCAFVLLVFVAYGAIAGAAHNHGTVRQVIRANNSELNCTGSSDSNTSSRQLPSGGECLVCQLHRNLFAGLLHAAPQLAAPVSQFAFTPRTQQRVVSQTNTPQRGRAPPTSLS